MKRERYGIPSLVDASGKPKFTTYSRKFEPGDDSRQLPDPSASLRRSGTLQYSLFRDTRQLSISSVGDVPHRHWQQNGAENEVSSMLYFNESVRHGQLPPRPPVIPGEVWDFSGSRSMSEEVLAAVMAGGKNYGNPTTSNADFRVISSNTFVMGSDADPNRHWLFYGCPCDPLRPTAAPKARRGRAKGTISCFREINNQLLYSFDIPDSNYNNRLMQFVPLQNKLRQMYPDLPLPGETIRVDYRMTSFGSSPSMDETQWIIVGALIGFGMLPLKRVS